MRARFASPAPGSNSREYANLFGGVGAGSAFLVIGICKNSSAIWISVFRALGHLKTDDVADVVQIAKMRVLKALERRGVVRVSAEALERSRCALSFSRSA